MNLQLSIHSSPRFATWIWIPDWRLLIDAGDGATQHLGYKIRKIDTVALTHSHRDHIGGLLQVVNQRGEAGSFAIAHPCGSRSMSMLENFSNKFNPGSSWRAIWHRLEEGDELPAVNDERIIKAFRTYHYLDDEPQNAPRSLGYHLLWRKQKVKPELRDLPQSELDALRQQVGREGITQLVDEQWITIGGDGEPLSPDIVRGSKLLLHEGTFLSEADRATGDEGEDAVHDGGNVQASPAHGHVHSTVEEALRVAQQAEVENVVLYHISTRYTDAEIRDTIRQLAAGLKLRAKVWAAMPRKVHWNLLGEKPLWDGTS